MKKTLTIGILLLSLTITSCWYNNKWEDLHPKTNTSAGPNGCSDTAGIAMSYTAHIVPLLTTYCSINSPACHKAGATSGVNLTTYAGVSAWAGGTYPPVLLRDLTWINPSNQMPSGGAKLQDCEIAKVDKWIKQGYPNN